MTAPSPPSGGIGERFHPEHSLYNRVLDLDWIYAPGDTDYCGGDVLMRRCALEQVDGFDPTLIAGEEPELCRRLRHCGYRILHIDSPMTGHDLNITRFSQYWRRALRAGHAYAKYLGGSAQVQIQCGSAKTRETLFAEASGLHRSSAAWHFLVSVPFH